MRDIIGHKLHVATPDLPLSEVMKIMAKENVHRLPIVNPNEGDKLVGIISDRDLRLAIDSPFLNEPLQQQWEHLSKHKVKECMKTAVVTIEDTAPIVEAAKLMRVSNVGGLPVLNSKGKVIGVCTRRDLLDHLIRILEPIETSPVD